MNNEVTRNWAPTAGRDQDGVAAMLRRVCGSRVDRVPEEFTALVDRLDVQTRTSTTRRA